MEQSSPARELCPIRIDDEAFLQENFVLPPLPALVTTILEKIHSGRTHAGEIAELLSSDPGLVAQILKIVNSAYYGLPRRITEAEHAVAYLGLGEIERLALTASVMKQFEPDDPELFERFWFHSFYSALVSKHVVKKYARGLEPDELHTAVLLHDVGKLVYMKFFPEHFRALTSFCRTHGARFVEAERELDCPSHTRFGALLCDRWSLPESVKLGCERHELEALDGLDETAQHYEEIRFLCLANLLSNLASETLTPETKNAIQQSTIRLLELDEQDFLLLMAELYELKGEAESFLRQL